MIYIFTCFFNLMWKSLCSCKYFSQCFKNRTGPAGSTSRTGNRTKHQSGQHFKTGRL